MSRHRCARDNPRPQTRHIQTLPRKTEYGIEHCRDAVEGGAFLAGDGEEGFLRVEHFGWVDDGGAVGHAGEEPEDEAEAVEEGRWAAEDICVG